MNKIPFNTGKEKRKEKPREEHKPIEDRRKRIEKGIHQKNTCHDCMHHTKGGLCRANNRDTTQRVMSNSKDSNCKFQEKICRKCQYLKKDDICQLTGKSITNTFKEAKCKFKERNREVPGLPGTYYC